MSTKPLGWPGHSARADDSRGGMLAQADFRQAVEMLPLVSIDLLLRDANGRYLTCLLYTSPSPRD